MARDSSLRKSDWTTCLVHYPIRLGNGYMSCHGAHSTPSHHTTTSSTTTRLSPQISKEKARLVRAFTRSRNVRLGSRPAVIPVRAPVRDLALLEGHDRILIKGAPFRRACIRSEACYDSRRSTLRRHSKRPYFIGFSGLVSPSSRGHQGRVLRICL